MSDELRRKVWEFLDANTWLERDLPPPRKRKDTPIEHDTNPVPMRGEALHKVWWRGRQWAVTEYGIECLDGCYPIDGNTLREDDWPSHMAEKEWVDDADFLTAWLVALVLHNRKPRKSVRVILANTYLPDGAR